TNEMLLKGDKPTRVGFEVRDGKKVRVAKIDGSVID
ncbi:MAG: 50S ribosomal protein L24, partial [Lachnospiraceae bacterium]|nr:50S ribosomal protein L24 [Lachnospiraceae bacterium]